VEIGRNVPQVADEASTALDAPLCRSAGVPAGHRGILGEHMFCDVRTKRASALRVQWTPGVGAGFAQAAHVPEKAV
jgi:hypothetical protein